jgi:RimJ/RimL family protein N-acetyltransferase
VLQLAVGLQHRVRVDGQRADHLLDGGQPVTLAQVTQPERGATLPQVAAARFDSIRTERLLMRRWRDADRGPFATMNADPEVMRYFPAPLDRTASDGYLDRIEALLQRQGFGLWALEETASGRFLGFTGLNPMPPGVPGAGGMEVG